MRMILHIRFPNKEFNAAIRDGSIEEKIGRIFEETKPEAAYFTESWGKRAAILVVDIPDPTQIPSFAEPWFLAFNAEVEVRIAMSLDDLGRTGIKNLGQKWA